MAGNDRSEDGRRLTKAERREQARLQREEIQRKMARRRRSRSVGLVLLVIAVATTIVAVFLTTGGASDIASANDLLKQAPAAMKTAGCDTVQSTSNYQNAPGDDPDIDHIHIGSSPKVATPPPLSSYPTTPPASGPHDPTPLTAGVYSSPPDVYSSIHALEHGGVIIWYAPGTDNAQLQDLLAFYSQPRKDADVGQDRVIIAPYSYPDQGAAGQLPQGAQMALVAWHRLQTCANVNLAVAFNFTSQYEFPVWDGRTYKGVAREPGGVM